MTSWFNYWPTMPSNLTSPPPLSDPYYYVNMDANIKGVLVTWQLGGLLIPANYVRKLMTI